MNVSFIVLAHMATNPENVLKRSVEYIEDNWSDMPIFADSCPVIFRFTQWKLT